MAKVGICDICGYSTASPDTVICEDCEDSKEILSAESTGIMAKQLELEEDEPQNPEEVEPISKAEAEAIKRYIVGSVELLDNDEEEEEVE